jgi:hypothetical protein
MVAATSKHAVAVSLGFYKVWGKVPAEGFAEGSPAWGKEVTDRVVSLLKGMGLEVSRDLLPEAVPVLGGVE